MQALQERASRVTALRKGEGIFNLRFACLKLNREIDLCIRYYKRSSQNLWICFAPGLFIVSQQALVLVVVANLAAMLSRLPKRDGICTRF